MDPTCVQVLLLLAFKYVLSSPNYGFYYLNSFRRAGEQVCKMCDGDGECITLAQARCDLYTLTSGVLFDDEGPSDPSRPELRDQVDNLMMDLAERASDDPMSRECIPIISQYTDCTKDNICLGCTSCTCTEGGQWNCSSGQRCRAEEPLLVDHRALVYAIEALRAEGHPTFRIRRSISIGRIPYQEETPLKPHRVFFEEETAWMYDMNDNNLNMKDSTAAVIPSVATLPMPDMASLFNSVSTTTMDPDYLAFANVLSNAIETQNYTQRKTLKNTTLAENYNMNLDNINFSFDVHDDNIFFDDFVDTTKEESNLTETGPADATETAPTTKTVTDLLKVAVKTAGSPINKTVKEKNEYINLQNDSIYDNFIEELNTINIMKRDVSQLNSSNDEFNKTNTENSTQPNIVEELEGGVYQPLSKIIRDKQQELAGLLKIKDKLLELLSVNQLKEPPINLNKSEITEEHSNTTSHYSFYNIEIVPDMESDSKRNNIDLLDKCLRKLKHDIFTVIKDLSVVQKLAGVSIIPDGMSGLVHAMKHYMRKHGKQDYFSRFNDDQILRRLWLEPHNGENYVKKYLSDILKAVDINMLRSNVLGTLSPKVRTILRRVLRMYKMEDFTVIGLRTNDPSYNLTNDLKSIGVNWQPMSIKMANSSPFDKLYNMKTLHVVLESDINKMNDALALIDFVHSRRMVSVNDGKSEDELQRINTNLKTIHKKITKLIKYKKLDQKHDLTNFVKFINVDRDSKKQTFLKHIRNLLKKSKKDLLNLVHKRVPKADIIKELAMKKLSELTKKKLKEYENVMQKWQTNLDVNRRRKRSAIAWDYISSRMKSILPKYLRGKVSPKLNSTRKNTTRNQTRHSKKKRKPQSQRKTNKNSRLRNNNSTTFRTTLAFTEQAKTERPDLKMEDE